MGAVNFQLIDDGKIDDFIIKREFKKINHQSGADVINETSKIKSFFGVIYNFIQVGNGFLEFDIKIGKGNNNNFSIIAPGKDTIRLINNTFAYIIHDARISASSGVEIEKKICRANVYYCAFNYRRGW